MSEDVAEFASYKHHLPGSKIGFRNLMFLAAAMLFFAANMELLAGATAFLIFIITAIVCGIVIANNPESGMVIDSEKISVYSGRWRKSYRHDQVDNFRYVDWAGAAGFEIHTNDGEHFSLPTKCYTNAAGLLEYLQNRDFKVIFSAYESADGEHKDVPAN